MFERVSLQTKVMCNCNHVLQNNIIIIMQIFLPTDTIARAGFYYKCAVNNINKQNVIRTKREL